MISSATKLYLIPIIKKLPKPVYRLFKQFYLVIKRANIVLFPPLIPQLTYFQRSHLMTKYLLIDKNIDCQHQQSEIIAFIKSFMSIPVYISGCIVEAGVYKGGSSAKFSLAARYANRELFLFDSFQGLPANDEAHDKSLLGHSIKGWFKAGSFNGSVDEVKNNLARYGDIKLCKFIKGWFDDTMPLFSQPIVAVYLDVDLAESTRTCLKYLYPLVAPGGVIFSQDGDFPLVAEVFNDDNFWKQECGCSKPHIDGLGTKKLIQIIKPADSKI